MKLPKVGIFANAAMFLLGRLNSVVAQIFAVTTTARLLVIDIEQSRSVLFPQLQYVGFCPICI